MQRAKVQSPPLRDETLTRDRLLEWLQVKIHHRVVFVVAEAGYGKTTLLADFSRRTRLRTLWYRLDDEDQSWTSFMRYLVAAGREQDGTFASRTAALLGDVGSTGPSLDVVLGAFVEEIQALSDAGAVIILDDYHLVDESPEIRVIMRELLARAPERVTFLIASRRSSGLPVARLRSLGEVAELTTDDLRFSESETEQLFRVTYHRPLEPDVVNDLSRRTEGWAASLQLVQAAIRGRSTLETRSFVRSLTGAEGDLYDYLAEEVVGDLDPDLQRFLMLASVLHRLDPELVRSVTCAAPEDINRLLQASEKAGLVTRRASSHSGVRAFHPLVRGFLLHRLERDLGRDAVIAAHLAAARSEAAPWDVSCYHLHEAGQDGELRRTLEARVREILGVGSFQLAASYVRHLPDRHGSAALAMIESRAELQAGRSDVALELAARARALDPTTLAAVNLSSVLALTGNLGRAADLVRSVPLEDLDPALREIATGLEETLFVSLYGDLDGFVRNMEAMADRQRDAGLGHHEGISLVNAASALRAQGDARRCLEAASRALDALLTSGARAEAVSAMLARDWALAHLGIVTLPAQPAGPPQDVAPDIQGEALSEEATSLIWYGDAAHAERLLDQALALPLARADMVDAVRVARAELAARNGQLSEAERLVADFQLHELSSEPAHLAHQLAVRALVAFRLGAQDAGQFITEVVSLARGQSAHFWATYGELLAAVAEGQPRSTVTLPRSVTGNPVYLSVLAEAVIDCLDRLSPEDQMVVHEEARRRPDRWRSSLATVAANPLSPSRWAAATLLDEVGQTPHIALLRGLAKEARAGSQHRSLGKGLARRLARVITVEDQGRVSLFIGSTRVEGASLRRKVLTLLCFLVSRPRFAATRDEVVEAMWPELDPDVAVNSLNQTVYFLRRVFEPDYDEQTSPEYLHLDSSVIWLDPDLVRSRTADCWAFVRSAGPSPSPDQVSRFSQMYVGRFALDFAYEEWAIAYRDGLHASYLQIVENAVAADTASGHYGRAIALAQSALAVDPSAETLEAHLVRLYRLTGAHAAAAEQYEHYASVLRHELGLEPPALESV